MSPAVCVFVSVCVSAGMVSVCVYACAVAAVPRCVCVCVCVFRCVCVCQLFRVVTHEDPETDLTGAVVHPEDLTDSEPTPETRMGGAAGQTNYSLETKVSAFLLSVNSESS